MKGIQIINSFYGGKKVDEICNHICNSAKRNDIEIKTVTSGELIHNFECLQRMNADFFLFWDKDYVLAKMLEDLGFKVFNSSEAIRDCDNKAYTYLRLSQKKIKMPKTVVAPLTFEGINYNNLTFAEKAVLFLGFPIVVKELFGSYGKQVYLARNMEELISIVTGLGHKGFLMQEFIETSYGRDIRINVVDGHVVSSILRINENGDFRSNISNGGHAAQYTPTDTQIKLAIDACKALGLDFAGVDVLFGYNDEPIICEVNSNPHFMSSVICTGIDISDYIIRHIKETV